MNMIKKIVSLLVLLSVAIVAEAHPALVESSHLLDGVIHFFSSADHLLTFVAVGVGLLYLKRKLSLQHDDR